MAHIISNNTDRGLTQSRNEPHCIRLTNRNVRTDGWEQAGEGKQERQQADEQDENDGDNVNQQITSK